VEYTSFSEAKRIASITGFAIVERTYEYSDEELVWTPDGSDVWPPEAAPAKARGEA
jgi:hypothetical protein